MATTTWTQDAGMSSPTEADNVENFSEAAEASKTAAAASATAAAASATSASGSETTANTKAAESAASATASATSATASAASATASASSATTAGNAQTDAETAETNASNSATTATTQAATATTKAGDATSSAVAATQAASVASGHAASATFNASAATTQAGNAAASATQAAGSASAAAAAQTAAETAETNAETAETNAETAETNAATSATTATTQATTATTKAGEASASATAAAASETAASGSETSASSSASTATTQAANASTSATASEASKVASVAAKTAAETAETNAETAQAAAETAEANAAASEAAASTSETNASTSAATATTKAGEASSSATAAAASETAAAGSETSAASSATTSTTQATSASTSATASETSKVAAVAAQAAAETAETNAETAQTAAETAETNAAASEAAASTSETNAATSAATATAQAATATTKAGEASTSATSAATSASSASASKDAALAALDSFDDRYLGQKTADPTVDNDGDALVSGSLYFNTTTDSMMVYEGSAWVAAYASLSGALLAASNLSDVSSAAAARTNLGLAIGTNVQAYSAILAATTASYTTAEETKLAGIEASADVTDTANVVNALTAGSNITIASDGTISGSASYTHPTYNGDDFSVDTAPLTGAIVVSDIDINVVTDTLGHVTDANGSVATRTLTLADLGYTGATNATANVGDITGVTAGSGLIGGGASGAVTLSHSDTSSQASVNNSGRTYIQDITLDTYGHITAISSATETVTDSNTNQLTTFVVEDGDGTEVTISQGKEWKFAQGGGININWTDTSTGSDGDPYDLTISHVDTSTQASVNNSGRTYIQDITLDTYGHITGITSATETVVNTDTNTTNFNVQANSGTQVNISAGEEVNFINGNATTAVVTNQANPTVTFNHNDTSSQASVNNSGRTYIQDITLDTYGHITGISSATETVVNTDTNTTYSAGTNLSLSGTTFNLDSTIDLTEVHLGSEVQLRESTDRADLLQITSATSTWAGLQIRNSSNEGRWSFMTDGATAGFFDDENSDWAVQMVENGGVTLYYNGTATFTTGVNELNMSAHLDMNNYDIWGCDVFYSHGDTNTYMEFHAEDQWRVVTGGSERLEVNNSQITSTEPIHAPSFHGDGSSLTGVVPPMLIGAVGTYALLRDTSNAANVTPGTTKAGSGLRFANTYQYGATNYGSGSQAVSGTWRLMGHTGIYNNTLNNANSATSVSVWVRIS